MSWCRSCVNLIVMRCLDGVDTVTGIGKDSCFSFSLRRCLR